MSSSNLKASDLIVFGEAAAGHDGVLTNDSGAVFVKPCTATEVSFYETSNSDHPDFADLMPIFMGKLALSTQEQKDCLARPDPMSVAAALQAEERTAEEIVRQHPDKTPAVIPSAKKIVTDQAIVLENIHAGFVRANVMDVKLGTRLWADDAPPEKRARLDTVSDGTTSGSMGIRISGMRVWEQGDARTQSPGGQFKIYDKTYGRGLSAATAQEGFEAFFCDRQTPGRKLSRARRAVLQLCEAEVAKMQQVLEQEESRIYSCSILFVFEGDSAALDKAFDDFQQLQLDQSQYRDADEAHSDGADDDDEDEEDEDGPALPKIFAAKLIDFAHATWTPGQGPDENMLRGVKSTRKLMNDILDANE